MRNVYTSIALLLSKCAFAGLAYVGGEAILAVDTSTNNAFANVIPGHGVPPFTFVYTIAFSPNGTFAYAGDENGHVYVIDTSTHTAFSAVTLSEELPPFSSPSFVAISPNGAFAYVADIGSRTIYVVDTATHRAATAITLAPGVPAFSHLTSIAISPDGTKAYATDSGNSAVYVIDTATHMATQRVGNSVTIGAPFKSPQWVAFSPKGSLAYVTDDRSQRVYVIQTAYHLATSVVAPGSGIPPFAAPYGITFNAEGSLAYLSDESNNTLYVIDPNTHIATQTVPFIANTSPFDLAQIALTTDGKKGYLTVEGSMNHGYVFDTASHVVHRSITLAEGVSSPLVTAAVAVQPKPLPPLRFSVGAKRESFGLQFELCNILQWEASPSYVAGYNIYIDGVKVASVDATTREYKEHNIQNQELDRYSITAFNRYGEEGLPCK